MDRERKMLSIMQKFALLPIILFIIGIFVILNGKIKQKIKNIIGSILIIMETVLLIVFSKYFNYYSITNFMLIIVLLAMLIIFNEKINKKTTIVLSIILGLIEAIGVIVILRICY